MKNRLIKQLSKQGKSDENFLIRKSLAEGNVEGALEILKQKATDYMQNQMALNL